MSAIALNRDALPACLGGENPNRLVSLWDIVVEFDLSKFALLLVRLENGMMLYKQFASEDGGRIVEGQNTRVQEILADVTSACNSWNFVRAQESAMLAAVHIETMGNQNVSTLEAELRHVKNELLFDTRRTKFVRLHSVLSGYFGQDELFGSEVYERYPSARDDIRKAGDAIAAEFATAAVFHLMRAVEWALRAFCAHLGVKKARSFKRSGRVKYTPISYVDWDAMLKEVQPKIDARIEKLKRGPAKQAEQEFFHPLMQDIKGFKDAWRNHVMHTRRDYSVPDAIAVMGHVQRFMNALAVRVSEY